jgi:hypothetical protein
MLATEVFGILQNVIDHMQKILLYEKIYLQIGRLHILHLGFLDSLYLKIIKLQEHH